MSTIIKNRQAVADDYTLLKLAEGETAETVALPAGAVIVPLAVWQARKAELQGHWLPWVAQELYQLSPPEFANMVRRELQRLA